MRRPKQSRIPKVRFIDNPTIIPNLTAEVSPDPVVWAQNSLGFIADPKQAEILRCNDLRVVVVTSRQAGKSTIAALRALHLALRHPGSLIMMTAKVAAQAGELLLKAGPDSNSRFGIACPYQYPQAEPAKAKDTGDIYLRQTPRAPERAISADGLRGRYRSEIARDCGSGEGG